MGGVSEGGKRAPRRSGVALDDNGSRLAMANWGVRVTVVETTSGRQVWTSNLRPDNIDLGEPLGLAFSPDGRSLAAVGSHVFLVLDAATGAVKTDFAQGVHAEPIVWSPDGSGSSVPRTAPPCSCGMSKPNARAIGGVSTSGR